MATKRLQIIGGNFGGNSIEIDDTLMKVGYAADAKVTGDEINTIKTNINEVSVALGQLDDKYYTESEIDNIISGVIGSVDKKSDSGHNHDSVYSTKGEVETAMGEAKAYADSSAASFASTKVDVSDIVDNLETTEEGKVLSANQGNVLQNQIDEINDKLADLMYEAITIPSFTISSLTSSGTGGTFTKSPVELGTTVTSVTLAWNTSKTPSTLTLDGASMDVSQKSYTYNNLNLTGTKTYTLKATDDRNAAATKTATLTFCNRVCYGAAEMPDVIDSNFVMSLGTKSLATSRTNNGVKYNAGTGQYLWYCVPTGLGQCSFTDVETGLGAGLSLVNTISVTNASGYEENYYVYKSDYAGLGSLTVKVS